MKALRILLLNFLLSSGSIHPIFSAAQTGDSYPPSDYFTFQPPDAGGFFSDPTFGFTIRRITDALQITDDDAGGNLVAVTTEYSSVNPFNMDNSKLILVHQSYFGLYDGNGIFLGSLPSEIDSSTEPRWSRSDPSVLYYHSANQLKRYSVDSGETSAVRTFGEYSAIASRGQADISLDGDHFVLVGDDRYIFIYKLSTDEKSAVLDTEGRSFDNVSVTHYNNVIVSWADLGTDRFTGVELYDYNMAFVRQLTRAGGHMDVTRDPNGEEVLVWFNSADPDPNCFNGIVKVRLADGEQSCLLTLDEGLAGHVSATDHSWVLVETYAPGDPDPAAGWSPHTNEIFLLKLDSSQIVPLAIHRSRPFNGYNYQPRASISHDAKRVVFSSNYGLQDSRGYPSEYSDAYLIYVW